jgi:biopolymer transport protein ExbD
MSDERSNAGGGASVAIVVAILLSGLLGLLVLGGGAVFAFFRVSSTQQMEMMEARARAEMLAVQMHAEKATLQAQLAAAPTPPIDKPTLKASVPELLLDINAAGGFKLAGKPMEYYDDLKAALLTAHIELGDELQIVISADKETRFNSVSKAVEAAECAGITRHRILTPSSQPIADAAATNATTEQEPPAIVD